MRHLSSQCRVAGAAFVLDGVAVHSGVGALFETTGAALVTMCFVDGALAFGFANVLAVAADRALEEAGAAGGGMVC